jgi:hypothetical protein
LWLSLTLLDTKFFIDFIEENNMLYAFDFKYAGLTIDAAIDDAGNEWIATPTFKRVFDFPNQMSTSRLIGSESFKTFVGEGFDVNNFSVKDKSTKHNNLNRYYAKSFLYQLVYYISDYEAYCLGQGKKLTPEMLVRHRKVKNLVLSGFLVDFEGAMKNAQGIQLDESQREYLRELVFNRIQAFRKWTDIIRDRHIKFYGVKPEGWYYGKLVKKANLALFGVPEFGNDRTENMTIEQQETIKEFECYLARKARNNPDLEPEAVLNMALNQFTN